MILNVKVIPNSKKDRIGEKTGDVLKIYVTAPPVDNKANKHLIHFLSKSYHIKKSMITIIKGEKSRYKTIKIEEFKK